MADRASRHERYAKLDAEDHLGQHDFDLDHIESRQDDFESKLGKVVWIMIGLLISVTTAAVVIALNVTTGGQVAP